MKMIHIADLHLGKSINGVNLIESGDQPHWVDEFLKLIKEISPDAVVIAGDVYDRSAPGERAVELLDRMLTEIAAMNIPVLMIAGNHDSGQRLAFGKNLLASRNVHIAGVLTRELTHVTIRGVTFWLMPYLFPMAVSELLGDETIRDYDTAVRRLLSGQEIDFSRPNVLVAHQNVVVDGKEAERGGSESMVGGVGEVDYTAFDGFTYAALGHIHSAYPVGRETVRYAGTPMCYHFNETRQKEKGPLLVEIPEDGSAPVITCCHIDPIHRMREIRGTWDEILKDAETAACRDEYLRIVITDRKIEPASMDHLRGMYAKRGSIIMENVSEYQAYTDAAGHQRASDGQQSMEDLFTAFYRGRNAGNLPSEKDAELFHFLGELVRNTSDAELLNNPDLPGEKDLEKVRKFIDEQEAEA